MNLEDLIGQEIEVRLPGERKFTKAILSKSKSIGLYVRYGNGHTDKVGDLDEIREIS